MVKTLREAIRGSSSLYIAATLFAFVTICVKLASRFYSGLFISSARFVVGALLCGLAVLAGRRSLGRARKRDIALRGLVGSLSMICTYLAVGLTAPGRATLLSNVYPLFVGLFGALLFGERLRAKTALSAVICTSGAVLVMRDGSGAALAGDLFALVGALLAGIAVNLVRRTSRAGVDPFILYLSPCLFGLPIMAWAPLPAGSGGLEGILLLAAVGVGAFLAQAFMAHGYGSVPAGRGSVIFYWETALTIGLGILLTGEVVNARFAAGLVLILAGLWLNRGPASDERAEPA